MVWVTDAWPSITLPTGLTITGADGPNPKNDLLVAKHILYTNIQFRQSSRAD